MHSNVTAIDQVCIQVMGTAGHSAPSPSELTLIRSSSLLKMPWPLSPCSQDQSDLLGGRPTSPERGRRTWQPTLLEDLLEWRTDPKTLARRPRRYGTAC